MSTVVSIVGGGAFGTALAVLFGARGINVNFVMRDRCNIYDRVNVTYLPHFRIPQSVHISSNLEDLAESDQLFIAVPVQALRDVCLQLSMVHFTKKIMIVACSKGIELVSNKFVLEIIRDIFPTYGCAIVSGPSFAVELAAGKSCILNYASEAVEEAKYYIDFFRNHGIVNFRFTSDIWIVQIAGALKNVIAIACGFVQGMELGKAAHAYVIGRGLQEIISIYRAIAGEKVNELAYVEPSCISDLIMTCSDLKSRNNMLGYSVARQGTTFRAGSTVEGRNTVVSINALAAQHAIPVPICQIVYELLYTNPDLAECAEKLLSV